MARLGFILRRLGKAVVVVFAIVVLNFLLIRMVPGDPALVMAGEAGAADQKFMADRLPQTLLLTGTAMALALVVGVSLGALAARRAGSIADSAITAAAMVV